MWNIGVEDKLNETERIVKGMRNLSLILAESKIQEIEGVYVLFEMAFERVLELLQQIRTLVVEKIMSEEEIQ